MSPSDGVHVTLQCRKHRPPEPPMPPSGMANIPVPHEQPPPQTIRGEGAVANRQGCPVVSAFRESNPSSRLHAFPRPSVRHSLTVMPGASASVTDSDPGDDAESSGHCLERPSRTEEGRERRRRACCRGNPFGFPRRRRPSRGEDGGKNNSASPSRLPGNACEIFHKFALPGPDLPRKLTPDGSLRKCSRDGGRFSHFLPSWPSNTSPARNRIRRSTA